MEAAQANAALSASLQAAIDRITALEGEVASLKLAHTDNADKINASVSDVALLKEDMATLAGSIGAVTRGDYAGAGVEVVGHWGAIVESAHRVEMLINRFWPTLFPPRVNELPPPVNLQQNTDPKIGG